MAGSDTTQEGQGAGMTGVAVGIVSDNADPEGLGRVKLRFPWRSVDDESYWARIAVPMAGGDRGTYFLPEVDDEVLVAFENGDIQHPYVVGALWNGSDAPPTDNANGSNDVRLVRSRSGHEVAFDDTASKERVTIRTSGGHEIILDDTTGSETVTIADKSGNTLEFDPNAGSVSLSSSAKISLSAPVIELAGDGDVTVESAGVLTLKGAIVKIN